MELLKKLKKLFLLLIIFNIYNNNPRIKILIAIDAFNLHCQNGFNINIDNKISNIDTKNLEIKINSQNNILINNKEYNANKIYINGCSDFIKINNNLYGGFFSVVKLNNQLLLINHVKLENYVQCVLCCEGWPGWPDEFNKAMAVVIRTYALAKISESRNILKLPYDIKNSNLHQTYNGIFLNNKLKKAIEDTQSTVLSFNKKPILAMFDCCCGGIIPSKSTTLTLKNTPYLARNYPCTYCKNCSIFKWKKSYSTKEIEEKLKNKFNNFNKIVDIKINNKDNANMVKSIKIKSSGNNFFYIEYNNIKDIFKDLKSQNFSIKKSGSSIVVEGLGYGHQMGLCQWGACNMARNGWKYLDILKFYYPNTTIMLISS